MANKHKNLYLYLALACFLGIILIFVFDGYMGVYDTLVMDNGQYPQTVDFAQWAQQEDFGYIMDVDKGGRIEFTYTVQNHRFSEYSAAVAVSLYHGQDKLSDILSQQITVGSFKESELKWSLDTVKIFPADYPENQNYSVNMIIKRGDTERKVTVNISPFAFGTKIIPIPIPDTQE
jgi:hypothetical protein